MHYSSNVKKKKLLLFYVTFTLVKIFFIFSSFSISARCSSRLTLHFSTLRVLHSDFSSSSALPHSPAQCWPCQSFFSLSFFFPFLPPLNHSKSFLSQTSLSKLNHNLKTNQIKTIKKKKKDHKFDPSESESESESEREKERES